MRLHHLVKVLDLSRQQADPDGNFEHQNDRKLVDSIMTFSRFTREEAIMVKPLCSLASNSSVMKYLEDRSILPIFDADLYFRPKEGFKLDFEFIECFVNGPNPVAHEKILRDDTELHCIALRFSPEARDLVLTIFVRLVSVFSSLSGVMSHDLSTQAVINVTNRFLSPLWPLNVAQKELTEGKSDVHMMQGWLLVTECLKVLCQELALSSSALKQNTEDNASSDGERDCTAYISEEIVRQNIPFWFNEMLCEFFTWIYTILEKTVAQHDYIDAIQVIAAPFLTKILEEMDFKEQIHFNMDALRRRIARSAEGEPSMAEIRYDPVTMKPTLRNDQLSRRVIWNHARVLSRCRSEESSVLKLPDSACFRRLGLEPKLQATVEGEHRPSRKHRREDVILEGSLAQTPTRCRKRARITSGPSQIDPKLTDVVKTSSSHIQEPNNLAGESAHRTVPTNVATKTTEAQRLQSTASPSNVSLTNDSGGSENHVSEAIAVLSLDPIESFYTFMTSWNPGPNSNKDDPEIEHLAYQNNVWLKQWSECFKGVIQKDVSACKNMKEYSNHWKPLVIMELRGSISSEIRRSCPSARNKTPHLLNDFHNELQNLRVEITKVSPTRDLIHLKCHSNDPLFTRALAKDLQGGMACFGYIVEKDAQVQGKGIEGKQPELSIFACRNVSWNEEQYAFGRTNRREDDVLDGVEMTLTVNRKRFKPMKILVGNQIIFAKLTTFTPYLHTFRALHETSAIPSTLRNFLCDVETSVGENAANAANVDDMFDITPLSEKRKTVRNLEAMIDPGCARYLGAIRRAGKLNQSQHIAVMAAIASMGDCKVERCSLSMIKGPPGTGKTDCIIFLTGAGLSCIIRNTVTSTREGIGLLMRFENFSGKIQFSGIAQMRKVFPF